MSAVTSCPSCAAGQAARSMVLANDVGTNVGFAMLPLLIALLVVRAIVRRVDRRDRRGDAP